MCEISLEYWKFNAKTWYTFLRISVFGEIYYDAIKLSNLQSQMHKAQQDKIWISKFFCKSCKLAFTLKIDNDTKQLKQFLNWLFSK